MIITYRPVPVLSGKVPRVSLAPDPPVARTDLEIDVMLCRKQDMTPDERRARAEAILKGVLAGTVQPYRNL